MTLTEVKWRKASDLSVEKVVTIGFINLREIKATVWTYGDAPFSACVKGEGVHESKHNFETVNAAKKWATKLFIQICKRF